MSASDKGFAVGRLVMALRTPDFVETIFGFAGHQITSGDSGEIVAGPDVIEAFTLWEVRWNTRCHCEVWTPQHYLMLIDGGDHASEADEANAAGRPVAAGVGV